MDVEADTLKDWALLKLAQAQTLKRAGSKLKLLQFLEVDPPNINLVEFYPNRHNTSVLTFATSLSVVVELSFLITLSAESSCLSSSAILPSSPALLLLLNERDRCLDDFDTIGMN